MVGLSTFAPLSGDFDHVVSYVPLSPQCGIMYEDSPATTLLGLDAAVHELEVSFGFLEVLDLVPLHEVHLLEGLPDLPQLAAFAVELHHVLDALELVHDQGVAFLQ